MRMKRKIILATVFLLLATGCAWFKSKPEKSAVELVNDGMEYFEDGDYKDAIEYFKQLKDWYPFSKYAILAELKIADAHFQLQQYEEAIFAYEEFETLHPRNEAIPYVTYQIGLSYFRQADTIDRDQSNTQKALDTFNRLIKTFPENEYAKRSLAHKTQCQKLLAGHDMYVGLFYYKSKRYRAALSRFQSVLNNYPDSGVHHEALHYIATCEESIRNAPPQSPGASEPTASKWKFWKFW